MSQHALRATGRMRQPFGLHGEALTGDPPCNCTPIKGSHDERCAVIRYRRSPQYQPDPTPPEFLRKARPERLRKAPVASAFD